MSIKISDDCRIAFDITSETTLEEKQKIARFIENARKAEDEKKQKQTILEAPKENQKVEVRQENKLMNIITSKRIAAVISLLLCITLYLSFLTMAFTTKRDTYICYTTKTGECFHSATCSYLNTAYETTVYEASQKYKACKFCNPCVKQYETTITDRNYVSPILISVPISIAVYLLLTYKKKQ